MMRERLRRAIRCCRVKDCTHCPMRQDFCDEMRVDMLDIPEELVEMIEEELENGDIDG